MQIFIELTQADVKRLVKQEIERKTGNRVEMSDIKILTKSAQNYKSEWETAEFKAEYKANIKE